MKRALEQIRRMRGGAQSHLIRCSDGYYYVMKFHRASQPRSNGAHDEFSRLGDCSRKPMKT